MTKVWTRKEQIWMTLTFCLIFIGVVGGAFGIFGRNSLLTENAIRALGAI